MDLVERYERMRLDRAAAMRTLGEKHPSVVKMTDELNFVESRLKDAISRAADSVQKEYNTLLSREEDLRKTIAKEDEAAMERARQAQEYQRLQRDAQRQARVFNVIVDRMKEVDLIKDEGMTNVSIVEEAEIPQTAVAPNKKRNLIMGAFLGIMLGVGLAYGVSLLDETVKSPDDVEDLGIPWLGYVPKFGGLGKLDINDSAQKVLDDPSGPTAEAFRSIRTNIYFSGQSGGMQSVMVTSCVPGEGKTVVSSNLAATVAHQGKNVLLVDADLRRPMIHKAYELNRRNGLTNILVENARLEDVVQTPGNGEGPALENLHVVTAGSKAPNPAELLVGDAMQEFMSRVRDAYDLVIYDSCPVMFLTDNAALANTVDGVTMVIAAGDTKKKVVQRAHKQLLSVNGNVIGTVLNKVKSREIKYYGSYGGYYYYSYDYYYYDDTEDVEEVDAAKAAKPQLPEGDEN
jgi:tyrosine-protein kinase Etk/Wzc